MRRFPQAQRAIAAALIEAREKAGLSARALAARLKEAHNYIARIESLERQVSAAELIVIGRALGVDGWVLMKRAERGLR